jgi:hypothetical protein
MHTFTLGRHATTFCCVVALSACAGQQGPAGSSALLPTDAAGMAQARIAHVRTDPARSWMNPRAKSGDLLYVSDENGRVFVFSYPTGALQGILTGFGLPGGLCSDAKGNVFVADTRTQKIYEYKHGATTPSVTLPDFGEYPASCAIDPVTGNLAVTNYSSNPLGPGSVGIYAGAKGSPTKYTDPDFAQYFFCGYDAGGNLFVDGINAGSASSFAVLPHGSSGLQTMSVNQTIGYPGGVQWDGQHLAVEDLLNATLYRLHVSGTHGTVAGTTALDDHSRLVVQFWIQGAQVIVPYGSLTRKTRRIGMWPYPAGGAPTTILKQLGAAQLFGTTVSLAAK